MEKVLSGGFKVCLTGSGSHPEGICGGTGFGSGMALGLILAKREGQDGGIWGRSFADQLTSFVGGMAAIITIERR